LSSVVAGTSLCMTSVARSVDARRQPVFEEFERNVRDLEPPFSSRLARGPCQYIRDRTRIGGGFELLQRSGIGRTAANPTPADWSLRHDAPS